MPLTALELEKPYLKARSSDVWPQSITRIEASFRQGRLDEMRQWLESGVLGRLLGRERKTKIAYHDTLPGYFLEGVASSFRSQPPVCSLASEEFSSWWDALMRLRAHSIPMPASQWLHHAATLPHSLADEWVASGSSPHALSSGNQGKSSPFLELFRAALSLRIRSSTPKGWPGIIQYRQVLTHRVDQWITLPGLTAHHASLALGMLFAHMSYAAIQFPDAKFPKGHEAWIERMRDQLIEKGATCSNRIMEEVILPCISLPAPRSEESRAWASLDRLRINRDERRESPLHQARLCEWVGQMVVLPCEDAAPWKSNPDIVSKLLAMEGGSDIIRNLFDRAPPANGYDKSYWMQVFNPIRRLARVDNVSISIRRIKNLSSLVGRIDGLSLECCADIASACLRRQHRIPVETMEAWLDCVQTKDLQESIACTWARCVPRASARGNDELASITDILHALMKRNLLSSFLCKEGVEQGSGQDLNDFREHLWSEWMKEACLARVLRTLPSPYAERATTMQLFFVDQSMDRKRLDETMKQGARIAPELVPLAIRSHLSALTEHSAARRLPGVVSVVGALAGSGVVLPGEMWVETWQEFGLRTAPVPSTPGLDMDLIGQIAADLHLIAPLSQARGEPMRQWISREQSHEENGYLGRDPAFDQCWQSLTVLLDQMEHWEADFSGLEASSLLPFASCVNTLSERQRLRQETPLAPARARPRF